MKRDEYLADFRFRGGRMLGPRSVEEVRGGEGGPSRSGSGGGVRIKREEEEKGHG